MISTGICRWLFLLISLSTWTKLVDSKEMRIVCYYTNWSIYRPGQAKFSPQNINPYLCTHLIYAFGGFTKENTLKPFDKYQDIEKGGYAKFTGLKTYNKNLKTMIAIGGWNEGSSRFSSMVASADRRKALVKNAIKFLRQNHFDGLDLDWEYPTFRDGGKARDRDNYAQLVKELREEFERESEKTGRPILLLTMAVPAGIEYINKGYDVPKLTKYLDWMNILSYDYHSAFEPAVNHHAPLYALEEENEYNYDGELNIDYTIKHYLKLGADPAKLVLGIPTYGRSYTLFNPDAFEIGAPADGPGDMGEATRENGYLAYYEICEYVKDQDWEVDEPNPKAMGPIAFKDNQWVGYDDENIVRKKAEYVAENSLGGIMFWAIDNDDFRGNCHGKPYPLIEAGKEALLNAYGLTEDNLISPPSKPTKSSKSKSRTRTSKTTTTEQPEESNAFSVSASRRRRIKNKARDDASSSSSSPAKRKKDAGRKETSTYSSLKVVTPAYTTPAPPATPDMGGAFKCEDEGFFPNPKDCKKYFWCLNGAGDTGIVAHAFTCPAGLYFNKGADSCDYSQNVLCNKKLEKAATASTTEEGESEAFTPSSLLSTSRVPPKITAATSKTTINFRTTTTTEAYEDEDEYEDEDDTPSKKEESEEDPRVIKELIDLIRKAGGIEELEKQLKFGKDGGASASESTTPSAISKSLVEKFLSKTSKNTLNALKKTSVVNRNSRGPQSNGREGEKKETKADRGRFQYSTLNRQRPSTEKSTDSETESEDKVDEKVEKEKTKDRKSFRTKSSLEYVNIRRPKASSTTEANDDDGFSRNKVLGELEEDDDEDTEDTEDDDTDEVTKTSSLPQYVNIQRPRPSTTESSASSSKYASIRRSTVSPVDAEVEDDQEDNKYKVIRRGSTTESSVGSDEPSSLRYQTIRRGTTPGSVAEQDDVDTIRRKSTTESSSPLDNTETKYSSIRRSTTTSPADQENNDDTSKRSTTESSASLDNTETKYSSIRRSTTTSPAEEENNDDTSKRSTTESSASLDNTEAKYSSIRRSTTVSPTEEENKDNTSKYQTIRRDSTTQSTLITSGEPISSPNTQKEEALNNITEADLPSEGTTLPTQEIFSNSNTITENLITSTHKGATESNSVALSSSNSSTLSGSLSSATTAEPETKKKRPLLFQPRPFSVGGRSTTTTEPSTSTLASKVSQSNLKYRLRPTPSSSSATEPSPITTSNTIRSRSRTRYSNVDRNLSKDSEQEDKYERTVENKPVNTRKRVQVTTSEPVDHNEESNRRFRPSELVDLSSLTAADLRFKGGEFVSQSRRRRPVATVSTTSTTEKTGSRTLTLARKSLESATFGKTRRVFVNNDDQVNASSDQATTTKKIVRGFRSTTPRASLEETGSTASIEETIRVTPRTRKIIRKFRPGGSALSTSTEKPSFTPEALVTATTSATTKLLRKRITLFRPRQNKNEDTSSGNLDATTESLDSASSSSSPDSPLLKLFKTRSRFEVSKNTTNASADNDEEEELSNEHTDVLNGEEGENIKLSESNIRESSQINAFGFDEKPGKRRFGKSKEEKQTEDDVFVNREKVETTTQVLETTTRQEVDVSRTEPSRILRTRKLIRKLNTSPSTIAPTTFDITTTSDSESNNNTLGRKRKILRRLRPASVNDLESKSERKDEQTSTKRYIFRGRGSTKTTSPATPEEVTEEEIKSKRIFRPSFERKTTERVQVEEEKGKFEPNKFRVFKPTTEGFSSVSSPRYTIYSRPPPFKTSDTDNNDDEDEQNDDDDEEEEQEDEEDEETEDADDSDEDDDANKNLAEDDEPKYTIYTTSSVERMHKFESNTNFNDEDEEDVDKNRKGNKSVNSQVLKSAVNNRKESKTVLDEPDTAADEEELVDNEKSNQTEVKSSNLFKSLKERPTFTRQRLALGKEEVRTQSQQGLVQTQPGYKNSTKYTASRFSPSTEASTTPRTAESESTDLSEPDITTVIIDSDTASDKNDSSTPMHETTEKLDITTLLINAPTEDKDGTITSNDILLTTTEELKETTLTHVTNEPINIDHPEELDETTASEDETTTNDIPNTTSSVADLSSSVSASQATEESTAPILSNLTESTTEYHRRSTLRSAKDRPRLGFTRRTTESSSLGSSRRTTESSGLGSTTESTVDGSTKKTFTRSFGKNRLNKQSTTKPTKKPVNAFGASRSTSPLPLNKLLYRYSTTQRNKFKPEEADDENDNEKDEDEFDDQEEEEENEEDDDEVEETSQSSKPLFSRPSTTPRVANKPVDTSKFERPSNIPKFGKISSTTEKVAEEDLGVDTEAVKNRNKNLFPKRKMNSPIALTSTSSTTPIVEISSLASEITTTSSASSQVSEMTTTPSSSSNDSTDASLTTLHHIFAQVDDNVDTSTESMSQSPSSNSGKVERLIEVNRIKEVKTTQAKSKNHDANTKVEFNPTVDKIGEVSRVTFIKIVDGNNETIIIKDPGTNELSASLGDFTSSSSSPVYLASEIDDKVVATVQEIPASKVIQNVNLKNIQFDIKMSNEDSNQREERKYEIFGESKVVNSKDLSNPFGKPEIIDGISHINVVTPKPRLYTEASTISLQGLFQTEKPHLNPSFTFLNDEVLETGRSEFVNVRVLDQDTSVRLDKGLKGSGNFIPVRVLPQDDTIEAHVMEISPKPDARTIKIVPIRVEMSRSLASARLPPKLSGVKT